MSSEQIQKTYQFLENLELWLQHQGLSLQLAQFAKVGIALAVVVLAAFVANYIAKKIIVVTLVRIAKRTTTKWDDLFVSHKVFHKLSHLAPALIIQSTIGIALSDYSPKLTMAIEILTRVYILVVAVWVIASFINAAHSMYQLQPMSKGRPIKGYVQTVKIIVYFLGTLVGISILFQKDLTNLFLGLGTSAAVLMLVFKDSIMGLVASIQVSVNDMVKLGDWVEIPSRNADGTVIDISLHAVKVQNWDKTITTIPTYTLVSESFVNWKGMHESSEGRRIRRSIFIDMRSVKFCSPEIIEKFQKIKEVKEYLNQFTSNNDAEEVPLEVVEGMPNGQFPTNLGVFRKYMENYIRQVPQVNTEATNLVRYLPPTEKGIPFEIYCFSKERFLVGYESVIAGILEHALSVIGQFGLQVFQDPSGDDLQRIGTIESK